MKISPKRVLKNGNFTGYLAYKRRKCHLWHTQYFSIKFKLGLCQIGDFRIISSVNHPYFLVFNGLPWFWERGNPNVFHQNDREGCRIDHLDGLGHFPFGFGETWKNPPGASSPVRRGLTRYWRFRFWLICKLETIT